METTKDDRIRSDQSFGPAAVDSHAGDSTPLRFDASPGVVRGLASVALGMTFVIASPTTMFLIWVLWNSRFTGFTPVQVVLVAIVGFVGCVIILTSAVFGLIFGILSISAARRHQASGTLGMAGTLLNGFSILLWIFIAILWAFAVADVR